MTPVPGTAPNAALFLLWALDHLPWAVYSQSQLIPPFLLLRMSQLVRFRVQDGLAGQGWELARWGSPAGKSRMLSQLGIQAHKASPRGRMENPDT